MINHTASTRGIQISVAQRDDLVAEVFMILVQNDYQVLRRFRRQSSLATYLTVIARRVVGAKLRVSGDVPLNAETNRVAGSGSAVSQVDNRDQIEQLMQRLDPQEADAVRMHHLEGKSYQEIGSHLGMPENSVGRSQPSP